MSKDLFSSRTPFEKCYLVENVKHLSFIPGNRTLRTAHVNRIFKAFLDGEWMPPIYVSADGEVLDGQNRLAAFRMLKVFLAISSSRISRKLSLSSNSRQLFN